MTGFSDAATPFLVLALTTLVGALLLLWSWLSTQCEKILLLGSIAYFSTSAGVSLIAARGAIPDLLSIVLANMLLLLGAAMFYAAICGFNGRPLPWRFVVAVPLLYCVTTMLPAIYQSMPMRVTISALLTSCCYLRTAWEVWRPRDGLRSRLPIAIGLGVQIVFVALRIPAAFVNEQPIFTLKGPWFLLITLESTFFAQVIAYLAVSLPKERAEQALQAAALTDWLTEVPNRRAFFEAGRGAMAQAARHHRPVSLILFDLDRFKEINDTFGHPIGDAVLVAFARSMKDQLRLGDLYARLGGEEFVALLPDTTEDGARIAAERVVAAFALAGREVAGKALSPTVSAGVACSADGSIELDALLACADRALYAAKQGGRNRVTVDVEALTAPVPV
jgi:diguanylate cyclase (GGDEF)-like protein